MTQYATRRASQREIPTGRYLAKLKKWLATQDNLDEAAKVIGIHRNTIRRIFREKSAAPETMTKIKAVIPE